MSPWPNNRSRRIVRSRLLTALMAFALLPMAMPADAACPKSLKGKRYSSQIKFYDAEMNLVNTCITTNILVVQNGVDTFPGTGYCTGTAGDTSAYTKVSTVKRSSSDACLQYFEGVNNLGSTYSGWNIVVDDGKLMYSVGATTDGALRFFDRLELQ